MGLYTYYAAAVVGLVAALVLYTKAVIMPVLHKYA